MKPRVIVTCVLLVFVAGSVAFLVATESRNLREAGDGTVQQTDKNGNAQDPATSPPATTRAATPATATAPAAPKQPREPDRKVVVYYFHTYARCWRCLRFEAWTQAAIEASFGDALRDGRLEWRAVNVEIPRNRHFIEEYQLITKSVVLVETRDGRRTRWKNLPEIWDLVNSKEDYYGFIRREVASYLKGS